MTRNSMWHEVRSDVIWRVTDFDDYQFRLLINNLIYYYIIYSYLLAVRGNQQNEATQRSHPYKPD